MSKARHFLFRVGAASLIKGGAEKETAMFRIKGEKRQDRQYHVNLIWDVYDKDVGAAVILAATYFEWCIRRCILALGVSAVADLRKKLNDKEMNIDGLKDLWRAEIGDQHEERIIKTLPNVFDVPMPKPTFDGVKLTWQSIGRARKLRNDLVHGARCEPLDKHGRKHVEILLAASDSLIKLAEEHKRALFKIIKRVKKV